MQYIISSYAACRTVSRSVGRTVRSAPEIDSLLAGPVNELAPTTRNQKSIQDLCSLLRAPNKVGKEIGSLFDDEGSEKHRHKLYRADTAIESDLSSRSLEQILKDSQKHSPDEGPFRRDRLQIAITLASSVLQLDGTLWLKSQWSCDDIFFHYKNGQPGQEEYTRPYLCWQRCCATKMPSLEELRLSNRIIRSDVLLALGLALVELCFDRTLIDMWKRGDGDINDTATRVNTGIRLHSSIYREMGVLYDDVVRRCLFQPFDVRELSLDIEEVQQRVLNDIIHPPVMALNDFDGE